MVIGNDDSRSQDERDSDGGDVDSPASQDDHSHQHPFSKGEEEGKREASPVQSDVIEEKYVEEATRDAKITDVGVEVEKEWEPKEDSESTHVTIHHVKYEKKSSSSRSNSDDESQASEKKPKEEAYTLDSEAMSCSNEDKPESVAVISEEVMKVSGNETIGDIDGNSTVETSTVDYVVKAVLPVTEELGHGQATEISANKPVSGAVEAGVKESEEKLLPSSNGTTRVELEGKEGNNFSSSDIPTVESSNVEKSRDSEPQDYSEKQPLVASTPPVVQRTSLLSCCGLLDVFTGSGR